MTGALLAAATHSPTVSVGFCHLPQDPGSQCSVAKALPPQLTSSLKRKRVKSGLFGTVDRMGMKMPCKCWSSNHVRDQDLYYSDKGSGGSAQREEASHLEGPGRQWNYPLISPLTLLLFYKAEIL